MMNKLLKYLNNPYPVVYHRWKIILLSSLIVFLVLVVFQPFGIWSIEDHKISIVLGYGLVTALSQLIPGYLFPALFPTYYKEQGWTVGKQLLSILILLSFIGVCNWIYSVWLYGLLFRWEILAYFIGVTYLVGAVPIVFFTLINQNRRLAHHLKESVEINACLQEPVSVPQEKGEKYSVIFQGGVKEALEVDARDLFYVEADGNYIKVVYRKGGKPVSKLLRATMKQAEEAIESCPYLLKCHRAFLVNVHSVVEVNGNSQGYRLLLNGCADEVPVSRAYSKEVKEQIKIISLQQKHFS